MRLRHAGTALIVVVALFATIGFSRQTRSPGTVIHEWGTFTTVAGTDGAAIDWLPLGGPTDLPCFVRHVQTSASRVPAVAGPLATNAPPRPTNTLPVLKGEVVVGTVAAPLLSYDEARRSLWGKVRMETPVIYFYSPTTQSSRVTVRFPQGVITEFYPSPENDVAPFSTLTLRNPNWVHTMSWNVQAAPSAVEVYPNGGEASHYYAARKTDATPLRVGAESEKFIFYRGVANFEVPIRVLETSGDSVLVVNANGRGPLPAVIVFESRNGRMGFRTLGSVATHATVARPSLTSNVNDIRAELHKTLVSAGLYPKEATAMLDTWRDSWFEEGIRVFYLLPSEKVDAVLPLEVDPAPARVARVFIGRMELISAATTRAVATALETHDTAVISQYARFLNPIADRIIARGVDAATTDRIRVAANNAWSQYNRDTRSCEDLSAKSPARE